MRAILQRLALLVAVSLAASVAQACAVCGGGNPANRFAFFASTMALSALPLGLFVGAFLWLRSRLRARDVVESSERPAVTPILTAPAHSVRTTPPPHTV